MNADIQLLTNDTTSRVIACAFRISNTLGTGFLEKVYENAMAVELTHAGLEFTQQCINYLRATNLRLGLLLNFGRPRLEIRRLVWEF